MLELRLLGALELRLPDGTAAPLLTGPKKVAFLTYLALEAEGAFHRRDTLLALFWPESDPERARGSLRNLLHALRRGLGAEALVSRGDEEVGLAPGVFACDAVAFRAAHAAARHAEALELYRGELLPGFHLSDAPAFERWLEEQREALRRAAAQGARRLAEDCVQRGERRFALAWARRELAIGGPGDEGAARRLIALLDAAGDRAAAIRVYDDLARWLRSEYESEPSPETRALIEEVRQRAQVQEAATSASAAPEPASAGGSGPPPERAAEALPPAGDVTAPPPEATPYAPPPVPAELTDPAILLPATRLDEHTEHVIGRRSILALALSLVVVVVAGAVLGARILRRSERLAAGRVVILPFTVEGAASPLAGGMVHLLSAKLDGTGALRAVDPYAVLSYTADRADAADPAGAARIAERFQAPLFILGSVVEVGGRYELSAALYDVRRGDDAVARARVATDERGFLSAVDRLAATLLAARAGPADPELAQTALRSTTSFSALSAYLAGEEAFRDGRFEDAVAHLRRAVGEDSAFALAYYRLAVAAEWADQMQLSDAAADRAVRLGSRLPSHARALLAAYQAFARRDVARAAALDDSLLALDPDDLEATFQRAEIRFHFGQVEGGSPDAARAGFEHVLALSPNHRPALVHLARLAALRGDATTVDVLVGRFLAAETTGDRALEMRALRAFTSGGPSDQASVLAQLRAARALSVRVTGQSLALYAVDLAAAERVYSVLAEPGRPVSDWAAGMHELGLLELARGRWGGAEVHLGELEAATGADNVRADQASLASTLVGAVPASERLRMRVLLAAGPLPGEDSPQVRGYYDGMLAAGAHDEEGVRRALQAIEGAAAGAGGAAALAAAPAMAQVVRAAAELVDGEPARALRAAEKVDLVEAELRPEGWRSGLGTQARFVRAEALFALRRYADALQWYRTIPATEADLVYLAPATLRRAEVLDALGRKHEAAALYRRFALLWRDADAPLQPQVRQALARAAALAAR